MIKLSEKEIKDLENKLWNNINEKNKYYFSIPRCGYSQEGYMLNDYYLNLNKVNDIWWLGIINTGTENNLKALFPIFKQFIKEKQIIGIYRTKDNISLERLHDRVLRMFKGRRGEINNFIYTIVKEV